MLKLNFRYGRVNLSGFLLEREMVPSLISDERKKTSVLVHSLLLPYRANSGSTLSLSPLRYSKSLPSDDAINGVLSKVIKDDFKSRISEISAKKIWKNHKKFYLIKPKIDVQ